MNARTLLRILNRPPRERWPDGFIHHGSRVFLLALLALAVVAMFPAAPLPDILLERGMVAEEDVVAEFSFPILRSETELARARQDAVAGVYPVFVYDSTAVDATLTDLGGFFSAVDSAATTVGPTSLVDRRLHDLLTSYGIRPSVEDIELVRDTRQRDRLQQSIRSVVIEELPRGVVVGDDLDDVESQLIRVRGMARERPIPLDSLLTPRDFYDRARVRTPASAPAAFEQLQHFLLVRFMVPSVRPDWTATEQERERARAAVDTTKGEVLRNERIVAKGDRIDDSQIDKLRSYRRAAEVRGEAWGDGRSGARTAGLLLVNLIVLSLLGVLLFFYRANVYRDVRQVSLLAFLVLSVVGVAALIAYYEGNVALVPIPFAALVVAALWDGRLALNMALILAVLLSAQAAYAGVPSLLILVSAGAVAALSVRVVRRRAQTWQFIMLIAGAYVVISVVLGLLRGWPVNEVMTSAGWGALSAIGSAFAAMGFLPLFEGFTKITTDQTLLELADVNRPLLRRLSMEAPGTYAHSINVANLAEAAAGAIGANALLTRVGVYYHDVGKMGRPHYFIENQPHGRNPHDKLKPATSASVVRNHVTEGLKMAEDEGLPDCVKAFITEHHGTQAISFFYDQARDSDPDGDLDPRDFAYPGPRPQSKETAIAMLADSVESAARALPDPNPDSIRELVDRIVHMKIDAQQLDEAPLTLGELARIKAQFVNVLTGMYHQRIDYPPTREERGQTPAGAAAGP